MATISENAGPRRRWLLWLHRVGYVTTALILAELLWIGFLFTRGWLQEHEMRAAVVEETRTHETALLPTSDRFVRTAAIELLKKLPPLSALHGDGVRFAAMPSFGINHYALAIFLPDRDVAQANGVLVIVDQRDKRGAPSRRRFTMPVGAYRSLVAETDKLTDGWPGDDDVCLDGSPMAFERVRGQRVTSGIGNCSPHYERLELLMLTYVRRFAPGNDLPTENDWHRFEDKIRAPS